MNWDRLKVFHQVARAGSFTNAAFLMHISQSALSRTIKQLEHELKTNLFHRLPHGLELTPQGKNLYTVTTRMFYEAEAIENLFSQEKNDPVGLLRIITTTSLASMWLPYYALGFSEKYPDMRLVITGNDDNLDLNLRQADVSIRTFIPHQPDLIQNHLITFTPKFFASRDYLKKHGEPKTIEDLDNHRLLTYADYHVHPYGNSLHWILNAGITTDTLRKPFLRVNIGPGLLKMAEQGVGILAMSNQYPAVQEASLVPILQEYEGPGTKLYYSYPKQMKGFKRIEVLNTYLQEVLNKKKGLGRIKN
jgi:DNA-binding transcriptional LysR family regulator